MHDDSNNSSQLSGGEEEIPGTDWFGFYVEGVALMVIGCLGLVGNSLSLFVYSKQKIHRIFHNLLFALTIFDMVRLSKIQNII